jgi:hydroxyacylglutathione hydrolase
MGASFAMAEADVQWALAHAGRPDHFGFAYGSAMPRPNRLLSEKNVIEVGKAKFSVYAAPGHAPGGIVLLGSASAARYCFVGDTIFLGSYGRYDLEGGDEAAMFAALHRLAREISRSTLLLCGHGKSTTMVAEIANTPFYS